MGPVAERARVLVVDDEPIVREVVARYLARAGYEVDTAADGGSRAALRADRPGNKGAVGEFSANTLAHRRPWFGR
jgi:DNA-binding NtrC family response regulator